MTTTNYTVGIAGDDRNSSKVLKPPGGETHDIFGGGEYVAAAPRGRNQRGQSQSNIFDDAASSSSTGTTSPVAPDVLAAGGGGHGGGGAGGGVGRRPANGNINGNNVNRIFGNDVTDEGLPPQRKVKDYHKSNIFGIGDDEEAINGNANTHHRRPNLNNHEMISATGTAFTPSKRRQGDQRAQAYGNPITGEGYANGSPKIENGNAGSRGRNPPGGHSTNLW